MARGISAERLAILRAMPYAAYLSTPEWRRRRDRALMLAGWCCQSPGCRTRDELEVHHRSYERLGAELDEDLRVFCPAHHHHLHDRYEQLKRLHWRVIRDVINSGPFDDFANFVETVKVRFARARIAIDPHELQELLSVALRDVALPLPSTAPRRLRLDDAPLINEREAKAILDELRISVARWTMAAAPWSDREGLEAAYEAARERAFEMGIELSREEFLR
jgi:hypothetical protein